MGSHPNNSRFAVRMAGPPPERKPEPITRCAQCQRGLQPTAAAHMTTANGEDESSVCNAPNADGRSGAAFRREVRSCRVMGVLE